MKITIVAGARPNFVKIAPILRAFEAKQIEYRLVHTGQHYDKQLSDSFFQDLGIPDPDINFDVRSGSQAEQTGNIMVAFEKDINTYRPDYVLVVGDVNSSMACGIVAKKAHIPLIHVEAGLRSGDEKMPEEINRIIIDRISNLMFTTTRDASNTLINEGVTSDKVHFVGNVMIDSLVNSLPKLKKPDQLNLDDKYLVLTLHRPSNVDETELLINKLRDLSKEIGSEAKAIFPVHPRTQNTLKSFEIPDNIVTTSPMGYLEFIYLMKHSIGVITDSGGIQEETTFLSVPCLTLRNNTERPETISVGTNELIGDDQEKLKEGIRKILKGEWKKGNIPEFWDGNTAERIADILLARHV